VTTPVAEALARALSGLVENEVRALDELTLLVPGERIVEALELAKSQGFVLLTDLTAVDRHPEEPRFEVVYLLTSIEPPARIRLKVRVVSSEEVVPTAVAVFAGANWLEREVYDMFGIRFAGHPDLKRILMPDDWEGYPLRKDFPLVEEPVQFFGHVPKVPSEIIPKTPRQS
jgi:NADH-quinone oxidoreductase subunit C